MNARPLYVVLAQPEKVNLNFLRSLDGVFDKQPSLKLNVALVPASLNKVRGLDAKINSPSNSDIDIASVLSRLFFELSYEAQSPIQEFLSLTSDPKIDDDQELKINGRIIFIKIKFLIFILNEIFIYIP